MKGRPFKIQMIRDMDQVPTGLTESKRDTEELNTSYLDLMITVARQKKLIAGLPAIVALLATAISLIMPNVYQATTKLLPPQQSQSGAAALLSQLGGAAAGLAAGVAGIKNPSDLYIGLLKSRTISDHIISQFDLKKVYDTEYIDKTRKLLEENTAISAGKDGLITIDVEDKDRERAAKIANAYVSELTKLTRVVAVTEASQRRLFFERQLEQSKNNLAAAEVALKKGLDTRGVISVDVESRTIVETVGRLRAQISAKEIQLNSMRSFVTEQNPSFRRVEEELNSLKGELSKLEYGREGRAGSLPDRSNSKEGLENIKLLRDVKYYQMLYELLAKQYEVARLDEAKDPSIIQVLDPAVVPERKFKPKRALIVILSTVFALFAAFAIAFIRDAKYRMLQRPEGAAQWAEFKSYLKLR